MLGAGDLIMLAIGAVIGAGIFGAIGTAAAGQIDPSGEVIRYGAGPALVFSFLLLGGACALAALCYAELASMIPQAGSAYAYAYATLGEFVAWIIGWDLILEYAVGNVAVAISWGDYFNTLLRTVGVDAAGVADHRLPHRRAQLEPRGARPDRHARRACSGCRSWSTCRRFLIVMFVTWLLLRGARESTTANNVMVVIKLLALGLFIAVGLRQHQPGQLPAVRSQRLHRHPPGRGDRVLRLHRLRRHLDRRRGDRSTRSATCRSASSAAWPICTLIYVVVGAVLTGMVPYQQLAVADPLARALEIAGYSTVGWIVALGAAVSMTAVLLVFQYGQPRIFFAMARDGLLPQWAARVDARTRVPWATTLVTGVIVAVAAAVGDAAETFDLTNIGTLFAFALVCAACAGAARRRARRASGRSACRWCGWWRRSERPPARSSWSGLPAAGLGAVRRVAG